MPVKYSEFDLLPCAVCCVSLEKDTCIISYMNTACRELLGYPESWSTLSECDIAQFIPAEDITKLRQELQPLLENEVETLELQHEIVLQDIGLRWFKILCRTHPAYPKQLITVLADITDYKEREKELQGQEAMYRTAFEHTGYTINLFDIQSRSLYQNQKWDRDFDLPQVNHNIPESLAESGFVAQDNKEEYLRFFYDMIHGLPQGSSLLHLLHSDASYHWYHVSYTMQYNDDGSPFRSILAYTDVTEQVEHRQKKKLYEYDELTGALNRSTFIERVVQQLNSSEKTSHALILLDLDYFKQINDTLGHQEGDFALKTLATTMQNCIRDTDLLGRMGGDEFFIFLSGIQSEEVAHYRLRQFQHEIAKIHVGTMPITVSMGLAFFPQHGKSFEELYQQADKALYAAKVEGRNRYEIFNSIKGET